MCDWWLFVIKGHTCPYNFMYVKCKLQLISFFHCSDVIMGEMAPQITSLPIVYLSVYSGADQRKTSKLRVTGLSAGNSPGTGKFPAQRASNAGFFSIWWRHYVWRDGYFDDSHDICQMRITTILMCRAPGGHVKENAAFYFIPNCLWQRKNAILSLRKKVHFLISNSLCKI